MWLSKSALPLLLVAVFTLVQASSLRSDGLHTPQEIAKRSVTTKASDLDGKTFDYVIIGGGQAGLVVASRLTEDKSLKVAVIEAGGDGRNATSINVPAANLYKSPVGTDFDWQWKTTPQEHLLDDKGNPGRRADWPRGKVLGGSSAVNGLYYVRHSKIEQNTWANLIGGANDLWGWDNMYRAMKKSETFSPPPQDVAEKANIQYNEASHGNNGPINISYPGVTYPSVGAFIDSAAAIASPINKDPDSGKTWGTYVATSTINPSNWTRSFSRSGYVDPYVYRDNLVVLTNHLVTKINFDTSNKDQIVAKSVNFAAKKDGKVREVKAKREVILSGGSINDPQILQLSGVGDANLLKSKKVDVLVDLPGVGQHLQDHLAAGVEFVPAHPDQIAPAELTGDPKKDSFVNSAVSYVNTSTLFSGGYEGIIKEVKGNLTKVINSIEAPDTVKQGYNLTYSAQINDIFQSKVGPLEILFAITFGKIQVEAALQHPMSRGSVKINSSDPFEAPIIDPAYFSQDVDLRVIREGFKLARKVGNQPPLKDHVKQEDIPGTDVKSDDQWEKWIRQTVGTEYHPSCSCSMLPREAGGVVDKNMLVYGTKNLRVIDASVPPLSVSAHLMSVTYGLAEIGAEIVLNHKDDYKEQQAPNKQNNGGAANTKNNKDKAAAKGSDSNSNNGAQSSSASASSNAGNRKYSSASNAASTTCYIPRSVISAVAAIMTLVLLCA